MQEEVFVPNGTLKSEEKSQDARFGYAMAAAPDLNHDGFADLLVGAPLEDEHRGAIYVYHGDGIHVTHNYKQVFSTCTLVSMCLYFRICSNEPCAVLSPLSVSQACPFPRLCSTLAAASALVWTWMETSWSTWRWEHRAAPFCSGEEEAHAGEGLISNFYIDKRLTYWQIIKSLFTV